MSEIPSRWLNIQDAALYLRCSVSTIRNLLRRGEIRAAQLSDGGTYLLDRFDVDRLLERRKRILPPYRSGSRPWVKRRHEENRRRAQAK